MTRVWLALTFADTCQLIWDNMSCCGKQNKERCQQSAPLCHFRGKFPLQCVRQNNLDMLLTICWLISLYYNQVYKQNMSCYIIYLLLPVCPINYLKWSYEIDQKKKMCQFFWYLSLVLRQNYLKTFKLHRSYNSFQNFLLWYQSAFFMSLVFFYT